MNKDSEEWSNRRLDEEEVRAVIEALLFISSEPVREEEILSVIGMEYQASLPAILHHLMLESSKKERGINLEKVAGGYRLATKPHLSLWIGKYKYARSKARLSPAAIETLSIIAYQQPITLPEIQAIRGVNPSGALKTLLEKKMIRIAGRKKTVGKPFLYGTTKFFLIHFGLDSLEELPTIEQFDQMVDSTADFGASFSNPD
jgi:segregation and condensation protein B